MRLRIPPVFVLVGALAVPSGASAAVTVPETSDRAVQQTPARDSAQARTGTSHVRGRVVNAETGAPLRRAIVRLTSQEGRTSRTMATDAGGKYDFGDLAAGSYYVNVLKPGFLMRSYGARQPSDPGKTVKVGDAEVVTGIDVMLSRGGVVTGRVLDEFGEPVTGAGVRVLRYQNSPGPRRATTVNATATNDIGQFRISGLQPGRYFVATQPPMSGFDAEDPDHTGYAPTYYPGTTRFADAQQVEVAPGQDANLEIMLTLVHTVRVSGIVLDSQGRLPKNGAAISVQDGVTDGMSAGFGHADSDGRFTIPALPPGDYSFNVILAQPGETQAPEFGRTRVSVAGAEVTGVVIQSQRGATISGQVVCEGTATRPQAKLSVNAIPVSSNDTIAPGAPLVPVRDDGAFTMERMYGSVLLRVAGLPSGWGLKAVYLDGRDVTDTPLALEGRETLTGARIVLTDRVTHLNATVSDEQGQPVETAYVVVYPDDRDKWLLPGSRYLATSLVRDGKPLRIDGLPPGNYFALAVTSPLAFQDADPTAEDTVEKMRRAGTRFSLAEGESKDIAVRMVSQQ